MKVAGLDLSLTGTGYALITDPNHEVPMWWAATYSSKPNGTEWDASLTRLRDLHLRITDTIERDRPDLIVLEGPSIGSKGAGTHDRSGLWWFVYDGIHNAGIDVAVVSPSARAKYATGKGNASKDTVLAAAVRRYVTAPISNNNEADATVLAAMGCRHLGAPVERNLPTTHQIAMSAVRWPVTTP